jgi:hypothetical protein
MAVSCPSQQAGVDQKRTLARGYSQRLGYMPVRRHWNKVIFVLSVVQSCRARMSYLNEVFIGSIYPGS